MTDVRSCRNCGYAFNHAELLALCPMCAAPPQQPDGSLWIINTVRNSTMWLDASDVSRVTGYRVPFVQIVLNVAYENDLLERDLTEHETFYKASDNSLVSVDTIETLYREGILIRHAS